MYNNTDGSIIIPNQIGLLEYDLHTPPRPMRLRDKVIITFDNTEGSIIIPSQNELLEYDINFRPCLCVYKIKRSFQLMMLLLTTM